MLTGFGASLVLYLQTDDVWRIPASFREGVSEPAL